MKKIINIIKSFKIEIIILVVFLSAQVLCDVTLPEYTSNIVDNGIQNSGIDGAVYKYISFERLNAINKYSTINLFDYYEYNTDLLYYELDNISNSEKEMLEKEMLMPSIVESTIRNNTLEDDTLTDEQIIEYYSSYDNTLLKNIAVSNVKEEYTLLEVDLSDIQNSYLKEKGFLMILISLASLMASIGVLYVSTKFGTRFGKLLRSEVVNTVMHYSKEEIDTLSVSSLITRTTNDITQVQNMLSVFLRIALYAPLLGIVALIKITKYNISWAVALGIGVIILFTIFLFIFVIPKFKLIQKLIDKLNLVSRETLTGIPVIRAFNNQAYEEKRFDKVNKEISKIHLFLNRVMGLISPLVMLILYGTCILLVYVGSFKIDSGSLQVGELIALITYSTQVIMSFLMIAVMSIVIPRAFVSLKRISEVLDKKTKLKEKANAKRVGKIQNIKFNNVDFKYPDAKENILNDIDFKVNSGEKIGIIGSTGSGKSTIINLLLRQYDVTSGNIELNDINIKNIMLRDLRNHISYVSQKDSLFSGTIKSNINLSGKANEKLLTKALKISQSYDFIHKKKKGINSYISQSGKNISGGQKQRLIIARAIAKNSDILIFDDSFSALDFTTDYNLRSSLFETSNDKIIFIISQRIGSIKNLDKILVIDGGKIVGFDTHDNLMKSCDIYREIALSQCLGENNE